MEPKRTKQFIINKMIQTGLIATKDEILPSKRKRPVKASADSDSDEDIMGEGEDVVPRPGNPISKKTIKNKSRKPAKTSQPLDLTALRTQIQSFETYLRPVLDWLEQSLNDAAEDLDDDEEDPSDDPDDWVPLVPFTTEQRSAVEDPDFQQLLKGLGFQQPGSEAETYWRIPNDLTAADIRRRARIVAGIEIEDDPGVESEDKQSGDVSDADSEDYDFDKAKLNRVTTQVYNESDDDEEKAVSKKAPVKRSGSKNKRKFDIFDMVKETENDETKENEISTVGSDSDSEAEQTVVNQTSKRGRLAIIDSDDEEISANPEPRAVDVGDNSEDEIMDSLVMEEDSPKKPVKRIRSLESEELHSDGVDEDEAVVVAQQVKRKRVAVISDDDD